MKRTKKFASVLLTLVMVLTMTAAAFAAGETGTITVEEPVASTTYTAYKIFDVSYSTSKDAYSYTIDNDNAWFITVQNYADDTTKDNGLTLTQINGSKIYNVTIDDKKFSAPHFAAELKKALDEDQKEGGTDNLKGTSLTVADGKATATGLELGYYFVTSSTGALCNLTTTNPTVTIHDKNDVPFDKTEDKTNVEIGEVVNYIITGKVPDTTGYTTYTYNISDKMSTGLTFNDDIKVYLSDDDELITEDTTGKTRDTVLDSKYYERTTPKPSDKDFELKFKAIDMNTDGMQGKYIFVTYSATINEQAIAKIEKNTATLEYSNNPADNTSTDKRTDEEKVYSAQIVIDKYKSGDTTKKLAGAKFVLMNSDKNKYYYYDETAKEVKWYELGTGETLESVLGTANQTKITEVSTNDQGAASFGGLKNGTYYLLETAAPAGYNMLAEPVEITINGTDSSGAIVEANLTKTQDVANSSGAVLPSTGGIGTTIFYIVGGLLVVGAGVLLIAKRRMGAEK